MVAGFIGRSSLSSRKVNLQMPLLYVRAHFYIYGHFRTILAKRRKTAEEYNRIPIAKLNGVFQGSIILEYYGRWKRKWSQLFPS
jgi:hypothetical protein